ncbi:hypothetical protein A0J57_18240 [Sphingobium sp. 22B]|nr:hypothetical protein AXW74_24190 [Sphingobium sp. AM]KYC30953.1 hypothetical protein A0J57_18240 [Sphingobium sp. 22B]OAP30485.1 hypothetical protein A8O16_18530 [Sphingobium sp. 20006FA]
MPPLSDTPLCQITIAGGELRAESDLIMAVRESARVAVSTIAAGDEPLPHNQIVERTIAQLRRAKPSEKGVVSIHQPGLIKVEVSPASADRLSVALNRIAAAVEPMGITIARTDKSAGFQCDGAIIGFSITENVKTMKHVLTEAEQVQQTAWQKERDRLFKLDSRRALDFLFTRPDFPQVDYHPTGQLSFELEHFYVSGGTPRRLFRDGKVQRLENIAADIAVGISVLAAAVKEERIRCEAQMRREEEERSRRERAWRAKHIEERRGAELDKLLEEVGSLDRLRRLVEALRARHGTVATGRVGAFVAFADAQLTAREEALTADALEQRLAHSKLFGEDDDFNFDPPRR